MAQCEHCSNEISPAAAACPRCGHPGPGRSVSTAVAHRPDSNVKDVDVLAGLALGASIAGLTVIPFAGAIVGLILGYMARKRLQEAPNERNESLVKAAIIIGWVGLVLGFVILALIIGFASMMWFGSHGMRFPPVPN